MKKKETNECWESDREIIEKKHKYTHTTNNNSKAKGWKFALNEWKENERKKNTLKYNC